MEFLMDEELLNLEEKTEEPDDIPDDRNSEADISENTDTSESTSFTSDSTSSNTLRRNPSVDLSRSALLHLLSCFEGELQARDVVIATLKSERVKELLERTTGYRASGINDPLSALQRDAFAVVDQANDNTEMYMLVNQQLSSLENLVTQQRRAQARIAKVLQDAEIKHLQELEREGEEKEQLKQQCAKLKEMLLADKERHKIIILFLLAERKKIILKYVEERKRSEDLAQILAEEKYRVDTMADGLEEESKKSLRMEAELEKQLTQFYVETQQLKMNLSKQEKRSADLETELARCRGDVAVLEKQLSNLVVDPDSKPDVHAPQTTKQMAKPLPEFMNTLPYYQQNLLPNVTLAHCVPTIPSISASPMMTSIAKVYQPTATASSVPVSSPMTGIARSVSPGQNVRYASSPRPIPPSEKKVKIPVMVLQAVGAKTRSPSPKIQTAGLKTTQGNEQVVSQTNTGTVKKATSTGRGIPPPVPPNKPVVPPKKENIVGKKIESPTYENGQAVKEYTKVDKRTDKPVEKQEEKPNDSQGGAKSDDKRGQI